MAEKLMYLSCGLDVWHLVGNMLELDRQVG